ncbi:MAG: DUF2066 domain-containing protein [Magnetococcales bacterium]|nr:DUF2066 domain-containing protein [Magnetococcales bacterium]
MALWMAVPAWAADGGGGSIYEVRGIEVSVPMSKGLEATHEAGVTQAQREGLRRLLLRMLTQTERETRKEYLATLAKDPKRLIERTVVRSEKQVGERLNLHLDLHYARKEVTAALGKEKIPFTEAAYPLVLLIAPEEKSEGAATLVWKAMPNAARDLGLNVMQPLGDLEDLTQLSVDRVAKGDAGMLEWATNRYGIGEIWVARANATPVTGGKGARVKVAATLTVARPNAAPVQIQASEEKGASSAAEAANAVYPAVAGKLAQQLLEQWVADHVIQPGNKRTLRLRVIHDVQVAKVTEFMTGLRAVPGMAEPRMVQATARESLFECEFSGRDEQLDAALAKLAVQREKSAEGVTVWLIPPAKRGAVAAPPSVPQAPSVPAAPSTPPAPSEPAPSGKSWL